MAQYLLGAMIRVTAAATDDQEQPVDPIDVHVVVTDPTGAATDHTSPSHPSLGNFYQDIPASVIGRWSYVWLSSGSGEVVNSGSFIVVGDDGNLSITDGPNSLWCSVSDVLARCGKDAAQIAPDVALDKAVIASNLLYVLSGRQFVGTARAVFRPCARPRWAGIGAWSSWFMSMTGSAWIGAWGMDYDPDGAVAGMYPPEVDLGVYPLISVNQVKIDGVIIPPDEYRIDDHRTLVRVRPSINAVPTERYGWPVWQNLSMPPTEPGTWMADVTWGMPPPPAGVNAAAVLAAELAKAQSGLASNLPQRVLTITRQGVSVAVRDRMEYLVGGFTGIWECDIFIEAYNSSKARKRPRIWSPDLDRVRRTTGGG